MRVDSISAPVSVAAGQSFVIGFSGKVGSDQCSRLARIDRNRSGGALEITFHGERMEGVDCAQMPVLLEHQEAIAPPVQDPFRITVLQPDGNLLERVVRVE